MLVLSVSSFDPSLDAIEAADLLVTDDFAHETYHPSRPLARAEAAGLVTEADVVTLGAILAGAHPGRTTPDERILVSPVGLGIEDVAWATAVYRQATELDVGARQRLWEEPIWT
jgi:ornithine cyclodeaminase/alanine dehydrogenase-like protein (mu-crystallin family)